MTTLREASPSKSATSAAAAVSNLILAMTALIYGIILWSSRRGSQGDVLLRVMDMTHNDQMRYARRAPYGAPAQFELWDDETRRKAEHVCQVYNTVGMLLRGRFLPRRLFLHNSGTTLLRCYELARPLIEYRNRRERFTLWPNFDWVAARARKGLRNDEALPDTERAPTLSASSFRSARTSPHAGPRRRRSASS